MSYVTNLPHSFIPAEGAAHQALSVVNTNTLVGLGLVLAAETTTVHVKVEGSDIRVCPNGTAPTASLGDKHTDGQEFLLSRREAVSAQWYTTGTTVLQTSQFKPGAF